MSRLKIKNSESQKVTSQAVSETFFSVTAHAFSAASSIASLFSCFSAADISSSSP